MRGPAGAQLAIISHRSAPEKAGAEPFATYPFLSPCQVEDLLQQQIGRFVVEGIRKAFLISSEWCPAGPIRVLLLLIQRDDAVVDGIEDVEAAVRTYGHARRKRQPGHA